MLKKNEKKGLIIYLGTVFGITLLMGLLIRVAFQNNQPISSYAGVQMMYPAMGVIIAVFFTRKDLFQKMKRFYLSYLIVGVVCIIALVLYTFSNNSLFTELTFYAGTIGTLLMFLWIFLMDSPTRKACGFGLGNKNVRTFIKYVTLFLVFRIMYWVVSIAYLFFIGELSFSDLSQMIHRVPLAVVIFASNLLYSIILFFRDFIYYWGEEYGWRYFLQPHLQKRYGTCKGLILVGIIWAVWHLPLTLYYYSPEAPMQEMTFRIVFCICLSFVMGYFYMKLNSIWLPVTMHFLNNGMNSLFANPTEVSQASENIISWPDVAVASIIMLLLTIPFFILCYRMKEKCVGSPKLCE
nr:type II CAAX endopeptidase family protein [uncultured Sellimonas sp.]